MTVDDWKAKYEALSAENDKLRVLLAASNANCALCGLPAAEMAKCASGFPGCSRADDMLLCAHPTRQDLLEENERLRKAQQTVQRESEQSTGQKLQAAISVGATLLSMFGSRKAISATNLGRATTAARGIGRTMKESQDVARAGETVEAVQKMKEELEAQIQAELDAITASSDAATEKLESVTVKPKKTNLTPKLVALVWTK